MPEQPKKLYYSISEVAKETGVKPHVLRYWESEFPTLRPKKTRSGSRRYRVRDIDEILAIKKLLYEEGFRIAGARKIRRQAQAGATEITIQVKPQMAIQFAELDPTEKLIKVREELQEILDLVKNMRATGAKQGKTREARG